MRGLEVFVAMLWIATGAALATRTYFVFNYAAYANLPASLEIVGAPLSVLPVLILTLLGLAIAGSNRPTTPPLQKSFWGIRSDLCLLAATLPLGLSMLRMLWAANSNQPMGVGWWEPIFFALFTGLAFFFVQGAALAPPQKLIRGLPMARVPLPLVCIAATSCGLWWYWQTCMLHNSFQLGFNDFGHFLLRVIRTARGQGFLMETPVLSTYWDHFNPGLALLVPLWWAIPRVELVFGLQAAALASCSVLIYWIARGHKLSAWVSLCWALSWLAYPSIGQMNVAYTYGWHPISFSIPALLFSYGLLQRGRLIGACAAALLASSFEEGAIAAIGCFAAMMAMREFWDSRSGGIDDCRVEDRLLSANAWAIVWLIATVTFIAVYRWSGLSEFQTGRFSKLGGTATEILLSPILNPSTFFNLLLRERNGAFLLFLLSPLAASLLLRKFYWTLLAVTPLLGVLLMWEHMPAQSLAFQYASVILPILFIGAIETSKKDPTGKVSLSQLCIGWVLCIYVGQFPWSGDTLVDVKSRAYGPDVPVTRALGTDDNAVFHEQIRTIRASGLSSSLPLSDCRVLATGRLASHFLGAKDLETVGQFYQRYRDYQRLEPNLRSPLLRYDLIVLDPFEGFQQSLDETQRVQQEAVELGFSLQIRTDGFTVLQRSLP